MNQQKFPQRPFRRVRQHDDRLALQARVSPRVREPRLPWAIFAEGTAASNTAAKGEHFTTLLSRNELDLLVGSRLRRQLNQFVAEIRGVSLLLESGR